MYSQDFVSDAASIHHFVESVLVPAQLVLAMLGMGATLRMGDFRAVFQSPRALAAGLFIQWLFVPALAVAFVKVLGLSPGWAVGLLLIAVVPGGTISNVLTYFGRGNVPLSISLTTVATLGCIVTIPLMLRLVAAPFLPDDFVLPTSRIVHDIFFYLLTPLAVGMVVLRLSERFAAPFAKWNIRGSLLLIILIAVSALQSGRIEIAEYGWGPPLTILAFTLLVVWLTPQVCRLLGRYDDDTVAITIEATVRNSAVGLLLVEFFFVGTPMNGQVLFSLLFYAGQAGLMALPTLFRGRRGKSAVLLRTRRPKPEVSEGVISAAE